MTNTRSQLLLCALCLLIGVVVMMQFRSQGIPARAVVSPSDTDQATFISQLYDSNTQLQQQVSELSDELSQYHGSDTGGKSKLDSLERSLENLRIANGEVPVTGPGVTVMADGDLSVFDLQ